MNVFRKTMALLLISLGTVSFVQGSKNVFQELEKEKEKSFQEFLQKEEEKRSKGLLENEISLEDIQDEIIKKAPSDKKGIFQRIFSCGKSEDIDEFEDDFISLATTENTEGFWSDLCWRLKNQKRQACCRMLTAVGIVIKKIFSFCTQQIKNIFSVCTLQNAFLLTKIAVLIIGVYFTIYAPAVAPAISIPAILGYVGTRLALSYFMPTSMATQVLSYFF